VLFSEPKIPQWKMRRSQQFVVDRFSALQRAENSSIDRNRTARACRCRVSVLFSEPKIPQFDGVEEVDYVPSDRFSALQRAENSSIYHASSQCRRYVLFQCSSASRKFLNKHARAERNTDRKFQCSSASRKFLNQPAP